MNTTPVTEEMVKRNIGAFLYRKRAEKGMDQPTFADWIDVHRSSYVKYENGIFLPKLMTMISISTQLNCSIQDIIDGNHSGK